MGSRRRNRLLIAAAALVAFPTTAAIAAPSNVDISRAIFAEVKPPIVSKPSRVVFSLDVNKDPNRGSRVLRSVVFRFARGFNVNRGAVPARCSSSQARSFRCPSRSQIGSASIVTALHSASRRASGQIKLYLGTAQHAAAGTVAADVRAAGHHRSTTGRIVHVNDRVYAYELRIDGLNSAAGGRVERIRATIGSIRTSGGRKASLIRNPGICPGGWHYGVAISYADGTRHYGDGATGCKLR